MDLEACFTALNGIVDDGYNSPNAGTIQKQAGGVAQLSDREVLTIALGGQGRVGVRWASERGMLRWVKAHGLGVFPKMIGRSAFNARVRGLWAAFIVLQATVGEWLSSAEDVYECVDSVPWRAMSNGQACRKAGHWLRESRTGHGGTSGGFYMGDQVLASVSASGVVTG